MMICKVFFDARKDSFNIFVSFMVVFSLSLFWISPLLAGQEGSAVGWVNEQNPTKHSEQGDKGKPSQAEVIQKTKTLQVPFIANNGQMDEQVRFYAKTFGGTVFVTKEGEIVYALPNNSSELGVQRFESEDKTRNHRSLRDEGWIQDNRESRLVKHASVAPPIGLNGLNQLNGLDMSSMFNTFYTYLNSLNPAPHFIALKEILIGAKINGAVGEHPSVTTVNYFTGNDKSKWKTNVPTYDSVSLGEVYKGVVFRLKAYGDNVEKLFCVKPGASPEIIKAQLDGGKSLRVNQDGQLEADTDLGLVKFTRPIAYQEIEGKRIDVAVEYKIHGAEREEGQGAGEQVRTRNSKLEASNPKPEAPNSKLTYGFTVASYDKTKDLIIDPLLASTYLGGSNVDTGNAIAIDASGSVYVTGYTFSLDFPTTSGAYNTAYNGGSDIFISKLNSGLTSLLASTYLGGSIGVLGKSAIDIGTSLAIDTSGNVYATGYTRSIDFPTTSGAYNTVYNGDGGDAFISKLNSGLTNLLASTYLGGEDYDYGTSLTVDTNGNVYATGYSGSTISVDRFNVFVAKLNSTLTSLLALVNLGGAGFDYGYSIALDASGNVYVAGNTASKDFPTTSGAYDTSHNGSSDVFISKLDGGLTSLLASTFLGGYSDDGFYNVSVALDTSGNVYVTGDTDSDDFPTTSGAYDTSKDRFDDVFISKLDGGLMSLLASTYLGGSDYDRGHSLTLDTSGNVYVKGYTLYKNFPTTSGAYDTSLYGADAFISKLDSGLTSLLASTFLGVNLSDFGQGITLDTSGNVYVMGYTYAIDFPTTSGAYDTSYNGSSDIFVSKFDGDLSIDTSCTYFVAPTSESFSSGGGTGSVGVTTSSGGCSWTAVSNTAWITITSGDSGTGSRMVTYSVSANTNTSSRTGTMTIAGQTFTVIEEPVCTYSILPLNKSFSSGGGTGSVGVTASSNSCNWTSVSNAAWITITSGASGTGDGTVAYSVSANTSSSARTGTMTIAGQTFTVIEAGLVCGYSISPTSQSFSSSGGTCSVGVTASSSSCRWTAVSNVTWITITSGDSGEGNGTVVYSVSANTGTSARTGTMTIAGQTFTVIEDGLACTAESITASPKRLTLRKGKNDTVTITVKGDSDCPVEGIAVTATVNKKGKRLIAVSPSSQETDANGQAVFTINAKDRVGNTVLRFRASGLNEVATVQVKVR